MKPARTDSGLDLPRDRLLSVKEVAAILGVSRCWVYKYAQTGELPRRKIMGRVMFAPGDVETWLEARKES